MQAITKDLLIKHGWKASSIYFINVLEIWIKTCPNSGNIIKVEYFVKDNIYHVNIEDSHYCYLAAIMNITSIDELLDIEKIYNDVIFKSYHKYYENNYNIDLNFIRNLIKQDNYWELVNKDNYRDIIMDENHFRSNALIIKSIDNKFLISNYSNEFYISFMKNSYECENIKPDEFVVCNPTHFYEILNFYKNYKNVK